MSAWRPIALALAAVVAVLAPFAALGGGTYTPTQVADPCETEWTGSSGIQALLEQLALTGFAEAACALGVTREELVLALRSDEALDAFAREHELARTEVDDAIRGGLERSVAEAERAGDLPSLVTPLVRRAVHELPPTAILDALERLGSLIP